MKVKLFFYLLSFVSSCIQGQTLPNDLMLDKVERATFQWFIDNTNPITGLIADRDAAQSPASIAGTGFGLAAYVIAAERGWISRKDAALYTFKVLEGLYHTPQGPDAEGVSGYHGFFYHFLDPATGLRSAPPHYWYSELSSIDTALLMAGILVARNYYDAMGALEEKIRHLCSALYDRVEWDWLLTNELTLGHGYFPETGYIPYAYKGYSEALLLYILAIGASQYTIPTASWDAFIGETTLTRPASYAQEFITAPGMPLFTFQYPMAYIDFRLIKDKLMRQFGFDYFENSRRATLAQWRYAQKNKTAKRSYNSLHWGFSASDGPGNITKPYKGKYIRFRAYSERGAPGGFDDGTIAPTAAISSIVFTPAIVLRTMNHWLTKHPELFNHHGFTDAFNPTFDTNRHSGWVDTDRLSIDQGAILLMIENYRSGLIWQILRKDKHIRQGLSLSGFKGGWLGTKQKISSVIIR